MTLLPEQTILHPILSANVRVSGELLERLKRAANRLLYEPPYSEGYVLHSVNYTPGTLSHFGDWSGDMSGRWVYALTAAQRITGEPYPELISVAEKLRQYQKDDGHFGKDQPISVIDYAQIYGNGWVLLALTEFALSTNDEHFLQAAKRLGDYYVAIQDYWFDSPERMKPTEFYAKDFSSFLHALEGLVLLYRVTQEPQYLEISRRMADNLLSFSESDHSHNFLSTRRGLLELYGVTGETHYLELAEADWERVRTSAMISTGGIFERFKEPPRDEGCSAADWLRFNLQLWQCTGKTQYLDLAERILLNHFFYNQLSNGGFGHNIIFPLLSRDPQEAVWCCSMHGTHTLAVLPQYLVTHSESEIFIGLYAPCQVVVPWPEPVSITIETDCPAVSEMNITVATTSSLEFGLNIRVAAWATLEQITIDGEPVEGKLRDRFIRLQRNWEGETTIEMKLCYCLWIEADGSPVSKSEIISGRAWLDASLFWGPLLLTHNTESIEGVSPVLLLPVGGNGQFASEVITCIQQRLQNQICSPLSLYEATGAEVWGRPESINVLLTATPIAPKRLCSLYPASERRGRFYEFPIILTDVE